jgi:molybdenum-dependent DNA-binding transcriptional regulator ModE
MVMPSGMAKGAGISYDRLEDLVAAMQRSSGDAAVKNAQS